jgi:hypothetical protein
MKIILVNGAPFSGKDTLVRQLLKTESNAEFMRFKNPLYRRFAEKFKLSFDDVVTICSGPGKDLPHSAIDGKIPRQELIFISEHEIKVRLGRHGVSQLVIDEILETDKFYTKTFIFPDSGFPEERDFLQRVLKHYGLTKLTVLRIVRDGCDYASKTDSRSYLENPDLIIDNNTDESHLAEDQRGKYMLDQYLNWKEST